MNVCARVRTQRARVRGACVCAFVFPPSPLCVQSKCGAAGKSPEPTFLVLVELFRVDPPVSSARVGSKFRLATRVAPIPIISCPAFLRSFSWRVGVSEKAARLSSPWR